MAKCRECGGKLKVLGSGYYGDTVLVKCRDCRAKYEVEPDGLGMGGEEMLLAMMTESKGKLEGRLV